MVMTSSRPYLIRALFEWIVENGCTPHILVDAKIEGVDVPQQYVNKDGQIVLNISPAAAANLLIANDCVGFSARFGGVPMSVIAPMRSILGIYARENGQGMLFEADPEQKDPPPDQPQVRTTKPSLKVIK